MREYISLFKRHIPDLTNADSASEWRGSCPFHACDGKMKAKFYINKTSGQFKCHRCGASGNAIKFAKDFGEDPTPYYNTPFSSPEIEYGRLRHSQEFSDEIEQSYLSENRSTLLKISDQDVMTFHYYLEDDKSLWRPSWHLGILEPLKVGWDFARKCLVFPTYDEDDVLTNLIHHKQGMLRGTHHSLYPLNMILYPVRTIRAK